MAKNIRVVIHHMKDEEKTVSRFLSAGFYSRTSESRHSRKLGFRYVRFSETEMSVNTPAINIQSIVLRRKRRNVILQPFAIVSRRERGEKKGATQHLDPGGA
jgi:hypothetical protein